MLLRSHSQTFLRIFILTAAMMFVCTYTHGQNLIGYKAMDIQKYMKTNHTEMHYNSVVNSKFSYLKFSDNLETQTVIFFLNKDSICRSVRIICDLNMKTTKVNELNSKYSKTGQNKWVDKHGGKKYNIDLEEGNWSCIISIEAEK